MADLAVSSKKVAINALERASTSFASRGTRSIPAVSVPQVGNISTAVNPSRSNFATGFNVVKQQWNRFKTFITEKSRAILPSKDLTVADCNVIKLKDDNVSEILKDTIGAKPYRIATSGYSFNTEGYEEITKLFLKSMDDTLGRKNTGYIFPPTLDKGSIYDISAQISGLSKDKALFATAEKYYSNFDLGQLPENVDIRKYVKVPTLVFQTPETYTKATANASNVLVCTGGRKVAVAEIIEALKRKHKVVLLHNLNLKNGTFNSAANEVENAARFFDEMRLSKMLVGSASEQQELAALLKDQSEINELVRVYLVNDNKSAAEAGRRAAKFIQDASLATTSKATFPSVAEVRKMTLAQLKELARMRGGLSLMKDAGVIMAKPETTVLKTTYGAIKYRRIKTPDGQLVSTGLFVPSIDGKAVNIFRAVPQEILQSSAKDHMHQIKWSTINPDVGVKVTQRRSNPVVARKIVTEGTLENSLVVNNSNNIPLKYDVVNDAQYIDTTAGRQMLTGEGFMVVYSSPVRQKCSLNSRHIMEDHSFMPADIAGQQYEVVTKTGKYKPCSYDEMIPGVDYRIVKKECELKMAVPPTEVISSEGEILAPNRLYMIDSKGHFYDGNPILRIKKGDIKLNFDMSDPVQCRIKKLIDEVLNLETQTKNAEKTGNKELAHKLSQKAKQVTQSAEQEMINWVKSVQNRNNVEFFI